MKNSTPSLEYILETLLRRIIREELRYPVSNRENQKQSQKPYLTVKEASQFSTLAPSTIRLLIRQQKLQANTVGRRKVISADHLKAFLESNR